MQEDKATKARSMYPGDVFVTEYIADSTDNSTNYIYESPDGGNTVTKRAFGSDEKTVVKAPKVSTETKKEAYKILAYHNIEAIELALEIAKENELS